MKCDWIRLPQYILCIVAVALGVVLDGCATAPTRRGPIEAGDYGYLGVYLDWMIAGEMHRWNVPGVSIAVVDDQRVVFSKGYGFADTANRIPATPETLYRIGSISKLITATEVVRRVDGGEMSLDDPINAHLPGFSIGSRFVDAKPITLRSLLAHHSGLPADRLKGMWEATPVSLTEAESNLRGERLVSPPQSQYKYSNLDYSLLGRVIEERGGASFAIVMQRDLLHPLGMNHSFFDRTAQPPVAVAKAYRKGREFVPGGLRDEPAGAMVSNVTDMARFISFVLAEGRAGDVPLVGAPTLRAMFEPPFSGLPLDFGHEIGLGWMLNGLEVPEAGRLSWHNGGYPSYYGSLIVARTPKLGVILLANSEDASKFATQVAMKAIELALEVKRGESAALSLVPAPAGHVELPHESLNNFAGDYVIFGTLTEIKHDGDHLAVSMLGNGLDLIPVANDRFVPKKSLLGLFDIPIPHLSVRFTSAAGRRFAVLEGLPGPFPFERIERKPIPQAWRARLGQYRCDQSDATLDFHKLDLVIERGVLVAKVKTSSRILGYENAEGPVALDAVSDDEAIVIGAGNAEGGTLRAMQYNGMEVLTYSGYSFTRVAAAPDSSSSVHTSSK